MEQLRVLLLDDGEMSTESLKSWLDEFGAHVITSRDFFEVPPLLDSQSFDVLIGHEVFLLVAKETNAPGARVLLTSHIDEWPEEKLAVLEVHGVMTPATRRDEVLALLSSLRAR
ncbi:MAG: hypothetical protein ACO1OB_14380 [Archangium sp.]